MNSLITDDISAVYPVNNRVFLPLYVLSYFAFDNWSRMQGTRTTTDLNAYDTRFPHTKGKLF